MNPSPVLLAAASLLIAGCASHVRPDNRGTTLYAAQQQSRWWHPTLPTACVAAKPPAGLLADAFIAPRQWQSDEGRLGPGDRVRLTVAGDSDRLTAAYVIDAEGELSLPQGIRIKVTDLPLADAERALQSHLVRNGLIRGIVGGVHLDLTEQAAVTVTISGAVFEAGPVAVGERTTEARALAFSHVIKGDLNGGRRLSTALRAAGGVRPDADPTAIYVVRGTRWTVVDMSGALDGRNALDLPLASGDHVIVQSVGCLQESLVRPSQITAPGIRVFLSNLSRPASSNSASAIGRDSTSLPYGTRLLQGLVTANCVGGSAMNAARSAVLISRNPLTGQSIVIARRVDELVRRADRDDYDPYLMPGDAIACYDSAAMNLRDVLSLAGETTTPLVLLNGLK